MIKSKLMSLVMSCSVLLIGFGFITEVHASESTQPPQLPERAKPNKFKSLPDENTLMILRQAIKGRSLRDIRRILLTSKQFNMLMDSITISKNPDDLLLIALAFNETQKKLSLKEKKITEKVAGKWKIPFSSFFSDPDEQQILKYKKMMEINKKGYMEILSEAAILSIANQKNPYLPAIQLYLIELGKQKDYDKMPVFLDVVSAENLAEMLPSEHLQPITMKYKLQQSMDEYNKIQNGTSALGPETDFHHMILPLKLYKAYLLSQSKEKPELEKDPSHLAKIEQLTMMQGVIEDWKQKYGKHGSQSLQLK
jgi:hypothetical protein